MTAYTYVSGPFNSTPFSSCCGVASQDSSGRPAKKCAKCGEELTYHDDGLAARRREVGAGNCLMCGKSRKDCYC
ncbi:MAG: hypothetical protein GY807_24040 [Gammaproteobacteria bacterium]|nr:hypothetical protein [Gammaproteobacteria bacterium]